MPTLPDSLNVSASAPTRPWQALPLEAVFNEFYSGAADPEKTEALRYLERYGFNRLPETQSRGMLFRLLAQRHNLLIYSLLGAAIIAMVVTLQRLFTYAPFMERFVDIRSVEFVYGPEIIVPGMALSMIPGLEKLALGQWRMSQDGSVVSPEQGGIKT